MSNCAACTALSEALDQLLQHLAEHPSNWPHGKYPALIEHAEDLLADTETT